MRRTASQVIRSLEARVARLERSANPRSAVYSTGNVFNVASIDRRVKAQMSKIFKDISPELARFGKVKYTQIKVHNGDYYHPHMMLVKATSSEEMNKDVAYFILTWDESDSPQQYIDDYHAMPYAIDDAGLLREAITDFDNRVSRL